MSILRHFSFKVLGLLAITILLWSAKSPKHFTVVWFMLTYSVQESVCPERDESFTKTKYFARHQW
jgi:hypothetical protein